MDRWERRWSKCREWKFYCYFLSTLSLRKFPNVNCHLVFLSLASWSLTAGLTVYISDILSVWPKKGLELASVTIKKPSIVAFRWSQKLPSPDFDCHCFHFFVRDGEIKKISFKKVKIEEFSSDLSLQGPLTKKETKKLKLKQKKKNRM